MAFIHLCLGSGSGPVSICLLQAFRVEFQMLSMASTFNCNSEEWANLNFDTPDVGLVSYLRNFVSSPYLPFNHPNLQDKEEDWWVSRPFFFTKTQKVSRPRKTIVNFCGVMSFTLFCIAGSIPDRGWWCTLRFLLI